MSHPDIPHGDYGPKPSKVPDVLAVTYADVAVTLHAQLRKFLRDGQEQALLVHDGDYVFPRWTNVCHMATAMAKDRFLAVADSRATLDDVRRMVFG